MGDLGVPTHSRHQANSSPACFHHPVLLTPAPLQEVPAHSWLKRRVQPPPNRYKIRPGRHWDGVVRGGKFEVFFFKHANQRAANESDAFCYAEDF